MGFQENEYVYLEDPSGGRVWVRVSYGMIKLQALGTIDGSRFKDAEEGGEITIVGHKFRVFRPGIVDLMESLDRGAQIITAKDAATILFHCDVKAGDRVIEVGAGSGGLTTALLHSVAPTGQVLTLEYREDNAKRAKKNVMRVGLDKYWSYQIGDARDMKVDVDWKADVLTMDMPDPWLALGNLQSYLRPGGSLCAYVPNMNQVESIVNALRNEGYSNVHALENLQRGLEVHPGGVRPSFDMLGHTGYLVFARKTCRGCRRRSQDGPRP
jgi:tRNA (adenine57-N1/adenine58-N1)-methyltransferase